MARNLFAPARRATAAAAMVVGLAIVLVGSAPAGAIVGGNPTSPYEYPYYVRLHVYKYKDTSQFATCGGSVIDAQWILTAAHCMTEGAQRQQISVRAAVLDTYYTDALQLIMHPLWDGDGTHGHDLVLLRIPSSATAAGPGGKPAVTPVQVGSPSDSGAYADGVTATIVGHGSTYKGGPLTTDLYDLHTPLHSDGYMDNIYSSWPWYDHWVENLMIGAGWTNHTVCNGDSGGPLTVSRNGVTIEVGVASFVHMDWYGDGGCDEPGSYAELSGPQLAWVAATIPSVAARWGACAAPVRYWTTPGRWVATYVSSDNRTGASQNTDGPYQWSIQCVSSGPQATTGSGTTSPSPTPSPAPAYTTGTYKG